MNMRTAPKHISILGILAVFLTFAACAAAQDAIEGRWKIVSYNFADKRAFPLDRLEVTLTVDKDLHIGGRAACNLYNGNIIIGQGGSWKLGRMMTTDMACNEINGTFEGEFLEVLDKASHYDVKGGTLTITDTSTGHFLRFRREGTPVPPLDPTPKPKPQVQGDHEIFYIGNTMSRCSGIEPLKCLHIKTEKNATWKDYYDSIIGFAPKPGRFYKIEVERVGGPPSGLPGDVSIYRHKLVRILKSSTREKDIYR